MIGYLVVCGAVYLKTVNSAHKRKKA
jgi:hypothetical protein